MSSQPKVNPRLKRPQAKRSLESTVLASPITDYKAPVDVITSAGNKITVEWIRGKTKGVVGRHLEDLKEERKWLPSVLIIESESKELKHSKLLTLYRQKIKLELKPGWIVASKRFYFFRWIDTDLNWVSRRKDNFDCQGYKHSPDAESERVEFWDFGSMRLMKVE